MGGRGSGGSRGGGSIGKNYNINSRSFTDTVKDEMANLTDAELKKAIVNTKNAMNRAAANLAYEQNKLRKMTEEFRGVQMTDSDYESKSAALDKQITKVSDAQSYASARTQIHYLAINERNNVREKHVAENIKSMTNGQLNSFYHKSYRESSKAKYKIEKTRNAKTKAKYQKIYDKHDSDFWAANTEKGNRSLGFGPESKNW